MAHERSNLHLPQDMPQLVRGGSRADATKDEFRSEARVGDHGVVNVISRETNSLCVIHVPSGRGRRQCRWSSSPTAISTSELGNQSCGIFVVCANILDPGRMFSVLIPFEFLPLLSMVSPQSEPLTFSFLCSRINKLAYSTWLNSPRGSASEHCMEI